MVCAQLCSGLLALNAQNDLTPSPKVPVLQKHLLVLLLWERGRARGLGMWMESGVILPSSSDPSPGGSYSWPRGGTRVSLAVPGPRASSPSTLGLPPGHVAWVLCFSAHGGTCDFLLVLEVAGSSGI